jgi:hypothetical protein
MNIHQLMLSLTVASECATSLLAYFFIQFKADRWRLYPCVALSGVTLCLLIANVHPGIIVVWTLVFMGSCGAVVGGGILFNHTYRLPAGMAGVQVLVLGVCFAIAVGFGLAVFSAIGGTA